MASKKLREEYNIQFERRNRHIKQLIEESIINVLAEQQASVPIQPPAESEPPPVVTPDNQANGTPEENSSVPKQYTVDDMIEELNSIRGGKSFTDPEVYGKLVTFFKNLSDEQKVDLNVLLTQIAELVTSIDDPNSPGGDQKNATPPPQSSNNQPPPDSGQKSAPMPGAQQSAGAAGVGVA